MKVGFIGTGLMGMPMANRLASKNIPLFVWNRTISKAHLLEKSGACICNSPNNVFESSETIILMVSDYQAIEACISDIDKTVFTDKTIIQMGTIAPDESRQLAEFLKTFGANYLEAPVLGSVPEATNGSLIIMAGGEEEIFNNCFPILETLGKQIEFIGKVGSASILKLALNQLIATLTCGFSLSLAMILEGGVDVVKFMDILRNSALYAPTFDKKLNHYLQRNFTKTNFPLKWLAKDVGLILQTINTMPIDATVLNTINHLLQSGIAASDGDLDYSAIYNQVYHNTREEK